MPCPSLTLKTSHPHLSQCLQTHKLMYLTPQDVASGTEILSTPVDFDARV